MIGRPSRAVIALHWAALAGAIAFAIERAPHADWDIGLIGTLLGLGLLSDLRAVDVRSRRIKVSGSFLAIITAAVYAGATPAAIIGVTTILVSWLAGNRYAPHFLLNNVVTYAWFPLVGGYLFHRAVDGFELAPDHASFYLLVFGLFCFALAMNFVMIAGYAAYCEGSSLRTKARRALIPLLPSELASALLAVGVAYAYHEVGLPAIALVGVVLLTFQYLLGALLLSQERADELEVRNRQLAGFQVALLSALLRTLDLRDRMTARHSAAVARYAREVAAKVGMSVADQELAHTAGLLHDIGKFVLPDDILKTRGRLTPEDWDQIKRHPYEGARIVSQVDGYQPVSEIILAHHERLDGLGYPRGLAGDEIPEIAKIIAVVDSYDAMTARDSYADPRSSFEAIAELRRVVGTQLEGTYVEAFIEILENKDLAYRHGEDADFDAELALDKRIHDYAATIPDPGPVLGPGR